MSQYDASLYDQFYQGVSKQVIFVLIFVSHCAELGTLVVLLIRTKFLAFQIQSLRVILGNLQAKSKERQWLRHQTSGELDDTKLIEGM